MTQKEAIDELILSVDFIIDDIKQHEEFEDEEQGEFQVESYENNKKRLEAYLTIFGALDPELKTPEALQERAKKVKMERYGSSCTCDSDEPSEYEIKLVEILNPWCKKVEKESGYAAEFDLTEEENLELAKINIEQGNQRIVVGEDEDEDEEIEASEDDTFTFYTYRGRVQVIYNGYADGDFCSYPEEFQKKAYEIIRAKLNS